MNLPVPSSRTGHFNFPSQHLTNVQTLQSISILENESGQTCLLKSMFFDYYLLFLAILKGKNI